MTTPKVRADWRAEADARIEKLRKGDFVVTLKDENGRPLGNTTVAIRQTRNGFHFGTCVTFGRDANSRNEQRYRQFIIEHFNTLVCENAMKWYAVEPQRNHLVFGPADELMQFAEDNHLAMRGHCLFWSKPKFVQGWVQKLTPGALRDEMEEHLQNVVPRYRGRLIGWDVNNEMLDGAFYKERLGNHIRAWMFKRARQLDRRVPLFVNEYGILGNEEKTARFIALIRSLQEQGAPVSGIGIQEHACQRFVAAGRMTRTGDFLDRAEISHEPLTPDGMLKALDQLAAFNLPIHLTEISSNTKDAAWRAESLEMLYRLGFSHPQVEAILTWGFWGKRHWLGPDAAWVDENWVMTPAGQRLRQLLLEEWRTHLEASTDGSGKLKFRGFHGDYEFTLSDHNGNVRSGVARLDSKRTKASVTATTMPGR